MTPDRSLKILRIASVLALVALVLMAWSLFDPTPPPVLIALSIGQALGTASFAAYLFVVYTDLRRLQRERRAALRGEPPGRT
jgi:peptidoglycan/LPS O-acetylase OafA/YrhL